MLKLQESIKAKYLERLVSASPPENSSKMNPLARLLGLQNSSCPERIRYQEGQGAIKVQLETSEELQRKKFEEEGKSPDTSGRTAGLPLLDDSTTRTVLCEAPYYDGLERPGCKPVLKESESIREEANEEEDNKHYHSDSSDSCFDERRCMQGGAKPTISISALEMTKKVGDELRNRVLNLGNQL